MLSVPSWSPYDPPLRPSPPCSAPFEINPVALMGKNPSGWLLMTAQNVRHDFLASVRTPLSPYKLSSCFFFFLFFLPSIFLFYFSRFSPIIGHVKVAARSLISYFIYIYMFVCVCPCVCVCVCVCVRVCLCICAYIYIYTAFTPHVRWMTRTHGDSMYSLHVNTTMNHLHEILKIYPHSFVSQSFATPMIPFRTTHSSLLILSMKLNTGLDDEKGERTNIFRKGSKEEERETKKSSRRRYNVLCT